MFRTLLIRCETRECLGNIVSQKKVKRAGSAAFMASASELEKTAEALPKAADVKTQVPSSLDNMIQNITPAQLEEIERRVTASTEREERLLNEDNLFQMEVSAQGSSPGKAPRVFWKTVTLAPDSVQTTFYTVLLDGRRVKAFETKRPLLLPTREYADAVRQEWAAQEGFVNKSLMPLTDIASAASYHVGASGVAPRIDYLMGFLRNDSSFFFQEETYKEQEELVGSAHAWFEKMYQIQCPRVERLKYPNVPESGVRVVREALQALGMNTYQAVSLCILCQYTASLVLPLALLLTGGRAITTQNMIRASTIEERYNIGAHKQIEGYHDIRQSDANTKMAASVYAWRLTEGLTHDQCIPAADSE